MTIIKLTFCSSNVCFVLYIYVFTKMFFLCITLASFFFFRLLYTRRLVVGMGKSVGRKVSEASVRWAKCSSYLVGQCIHTWWNTEPPLRVDSAGVCPMSRSLRGLVVGTNILGSNIVKNYNMFSVIWYFLIFCLMFFRLWFLSRPESVFVFVNYEQVDEKCTRWSTLKGCLQIMRFQ